LEKYTNIKFIKNPSTGSRVISRGRLDEPTDMTKLIVAFRNFANAPKNKEETFDMHLTQKRKEVAGK